MLELIIGAGLKAFFNALLENIFGFLDRQIQSAQQRELGRLEAERNQAIEGLQAQQEMVVIAAQPVDVLKRLEEGSL